MTGPTVPDDGDVDPPTPPSLLIQTMTAEVPVSPDNAFSTEECFLYAGATYRAISSVNHTHAAPASVSNKITIAMWAGDAYPRENTDRVWFQAMGSVREGDAETADTHDFVIGEDQYVYMRITHSPYAGTNGTGSSVVTELYYVSGPDPRFT
jgi:hypothetical protein